LLVKCGQLVQTQKKRTDGWWYGFVVHDDDATMGDTNCDGASGWFPAACTSNPTAKQLASLQKALGGVEEAKDCLAPPPAWSNIDPRGCQLVALTASGLHAQEYSKVIGAFKGSLGRSTTIMSVERIQNVALWQSYAAKKKTMLLRGQAENLPTASYEKPMLFHGTSEWAAEKICEQGFNRSFCGKNATAHGKGVYFAVNSSYSSSSTYSPPDQSGVKRMFVCHVLVGETCYGNSSHVVPDARTGKLLYDSTTDNVQHPQMFITYHDAQAYPAYIVKFK
jgi:poly [ADP-ribose] polymerase 10/14/15